MYHKFETRSILRAFVQLAMMLIAHWPSNCCGPYGLDAWELKVDAPLDVKNIRHQPQEICHHVLSDRSMSDGTVAAWICCSLRMEGKKARNAQRFILPGQPILLELIVPSIINPRIKANL